MNPDYITRRGLFKAVRSIAPLIKGNVLDFGCGSKPYEYLFVNATKYIGCDIQTSGHDHTESRVDVFYDGLTLPFSDATFDSVVSFEVFEHIFNLPDVLSEIRRVTKPDGYLLITIPFAYEEHEVPYDFARYTCYGISTVLQTAGYEVIKNEKSGGYLLAVHQMLMIYIVRLLPKSKLLFNSVQALILFPLTSFVLLLDLILPRHYDFYCNNIVLTKKRKEESSETPV